MMEAAQQCDLAAPCGRCLVANVMATVAADGGGGVMGLRTLHQRIRAGHDYARIRLSGLFPCCRALPDG